MKLYEFSALFNLIYNQRIFKKNQIHFNWVNIPLLLLLLLPLYPELSEFSLLIQLFPATLYGSSSSGIGKRGRLLTFTVRCTGHSRKRVKNPLSNVFNLIVYYIIAV